MSWDFSGWATKNDLVCADGRTIKKDAFKECDGQTVPLVWNHDYSGPDNILGHALLENRDEGVYAYCSFNDSEGGLAAKEAVKHGDVKSLSIYANRLTQDNKKNVLHGMIRELSLVMHGANPGATIDFVMAHSEDGSELDEAICANYDENIMLYHSEEEPPKEDKPKIKMDEKKDDKSEKTIGDIIETMNDEQKRVVYAIAAELEERATAASNNDEKEEEKEMKQNAFDNNGQLGEDELKHSEEFISTMINDAKRQGSMKESYLVHSEEYGIQNLEYLFPEAKALTNQPEFIQRANGWVQKVMSGVHRSPMSRVKSIFADITEDEARAKGYIKGKLKKEEVFSLLKRSTSSTTVYKKQKMDRDDVVDITDIDVITWLKAEMRMMLDEELARAFLIGDGRLSSSDDKIDEQRIRPIVNDADLFVIRWSVASGSAEGDKAKNFIKAAIKSRKNYKGSGNPMLFTTEDMLTDMLLLEDTIGHRLYKTEAELATALRVKEIVTVPVMEGLKDSASKDVYGIIVNLNDYNVGADKGGAINMFDDFDIDYNQQKYLIETRCSGALVKPFSAIVLRSGDATASEEPGLAAAKAALNN